MPSFVHHCLLTQCNLCDHHACAQVPEEQRDAVYAKRFGTELSEEEGDAMRRGRSDRSKKEPKAPTADVRARFLSPWCACHHHHTSGVLLDECARMHGWRGAVAWCDVAVFHRRFSGGCLSLRRSTHGTTMVEAAAALRARMRSRMSPRWCRMQPWMLTLLGLEPEPDLEPELELEHWSRKSSRAMTCTCKRVMCAGWLLGGVRGGSWGG